MNSLRALDAFPMLTMRCVENLEDRKREGFPSPLWWTAYMFISGKTLHDLTPRVTFARPPVTPGSPFGSICASNTFRAPRCPREGATN